jgi:uncharacterized SAM-binding protein YcdF (DUF218 family)
MLGFMAGARPQAPSPMPTGGHQTADDHHMSRQRPWAWRLTFGALCAVVFGALTGFVWFVLSVQKSETAITTSADGVVVLTGGPERLAEGVDLLTAGRAKRLLITGVHTTTRLEELSKRVPGHDRMFHCCVDIDREATNTIGNAVETRRWALERGFNSLIVVTSSYHIPRAMAEVSHQLPDATLIPYPVVIDRQHTGPWWSHTLTARTFAIEYIKYIAAIVRMRFEPTPSGTALAAAQADARR